MLTYARQRVIGWVGLLIAAAVVVPDEAADESEAAMLTVVVINSRSNEGKMHFALYDSAEGFTDHAVEGGAVAIKERRAEWQVGKLKPGEYAVACFHDENGDGKFNQNFIGIPLEDYGFSNEARAGLGPPSWKKVVFRINPGSNRHIIRIRKK